MSAFTTYTNSIKNINLTREWGVSLLVRESFIQTGDWWVAGYATSISTSGCECHPVMVKPVEGTLYVKTALKGGAADALWEELVSLCPEFHDILRA